MRDGSEMHPDRLLPAYVSGSLDAPAAARVRQHLERCPECRDALAAWRAIGDAACFDAAQLPAPRPGLLVEVWAQIDREAARTAVNSSWTERLSAMIQPKRFARPLVGLAAAAAVVGAVAFTAVGQSYAQGFLTIFTPQHFQAVTVSQADLKSLPDLSDYGTVTQPGHVQPISAADLSSAEKASGLALLAPSTLPNGVQPTARYEVIPSESGAFTFSAARAAATAKAKGKTLPPMPSNIDGSSIQITTGNAVVAIYRMNGSSSSAAATKNGEAQSAENLPALVIGQTTAPTIQSTGVSVSQLEQYLLAQPGISPDLANAIRSIGDPTTTLAIPIPVDKAVSHPVSVQGVQGLSVADSTGLGGGIIWEKNGTIYGVAGAFPESQLLAVANSLR